MKLTSIESASVIIKAFGIPEKILEFKNFGDGHINETYLVITEGPDKVKNKYILQSINTNIFKNIYAVMDNISKVTDYLKAHNTDNSKVFMQFLSSEGGKKYFIDSENNFWRMYRFIDNSISIQLPENLEDIYQCSYAFGEFQHSLNEFPADSLTEIIPDFHNTPKRYKDFLKAVENDTCGRASSVKEEIEFIKKRASFYPMLIDCNKKGDLPLRVSHNDTKCNNVLLDADTRKAVTVIDLDTLMPGFSVTDFGDAVRFGASTAAEDEKDLSKVHMDIEKFKIYVKGFLDGSGGLLTNTEIMLLPEGTKMMTIECGMRFLTDYLEGDTYFSIHRPEQNLDRCRTQLKLVEDMESKWEQMKAYVVGFTSYSK